MRTNYFVGKITLKIIIILFCLISPVVAEDLCIISLKGNFFLWKDSESTLELLDTRIANKTINDTYYEPSSKVVFITTDEGKMYAINVSDAPTINEIDLGCATAFFTFYDAVNEGPAWIGDSTNSTTEKLFFVRKPDGQVQQTQASNIFFTKGFVLGLQFVGLQSSQILINKYSELAPILANYSNDEWMIIGRSEGLEVYGRKIDHIIADGDKYKATFLIRDIANDRWLLKKLNEYGEAETYNESLVIKGIYDIKGDRSAETNNEIQGIYSGKWYFFVPSRNLNVSYGLEDGVKVHYATSNKAFLSKGRKILSLNIQASGSNKPTIITELPEPYSIFAVYPR